MIARYVRCAVAAIVLFAALGAVPAFAEDTTLCPGADKPNANITVNGKSGQKYVVTSASGLTAMAPDGMSFIKMFGFLYTTKGAGAFVQDGTFPPGPIFSVAGTDTTSVSKGLAKLAKDPSGFKLSKGAQAIVSRGWSVVIFSCNP
jgi:hypothetical protein